jgi:phage host-nuclease inhibitor protein Gam
MREDQVARAACDATLAQLAELTAALRILEHDCELELETIRARYADDLARLTEAIKAQDGRLRTLMREHRGVLFDGVDKIRLTHGSLLYKKGWKLTIKKGALAAIKEHGWTEAVKVAESVDRDVVMEWPEERIAAIGGTKRLAEEYNYELYSGESG